RALLDVDPPLLLTLAPALSQAGVGRGRLAQRENHPGGALVDARDEPGGSPRPLAPGPGPQRGELRSLIQGHRRGVADDGVEGGQVKLVKGHAIERALDDQERKPPMDVIEFRPERDQYAFTFGGVAPVRKVQPGTMLRLWTDDAFCGNLREPSDMPSAKLTMPFVNPQTGPFYVE